MCPNIQTCSCTCTICIAAVILHFRLAWRFDSATQFVKSKFFGRQLMMVTMLQLNSGQRCLDQMLLNSSPKVFGISFGHFPSSTSSKTHTRWGHYKSVAADIGCYVILCLCICLFERRHLLVTRWRKCCKRFSQLLPCLKLISFPKLLRRWVSTSGGPCNLMLSQQPSHLPSPKKE